MTTSTLSKKSRLLNEFSWSFSRHSTFVECKKKYWYNYYGSWEGWPATPYDSRQAIDPLASHLYMLKNIQAFVMFIGSAVHKAIEHFLQEYKRSKKALGLEELLAFAYALYEKGIEESRSGLWHKSPKKHSHLFEHYYEGATKNSALIPKAMEEGKEKIALCLTHWYNSQVHRVLLDQRSSVQSIEEMGSFLLDDHFKIIVVIDCALKWKSSPDKPEVVILFDWKTGKQNEKNSEQLYAYALFAHKVWKIPYDQIVLSAFYLLDNSYTKVGAQQAIAITAEKMQQMEQVIRASCDQMQSFVKETPAPGYYPDPTLFPYTQDRRSCTFCTFKEVCQGAQYQELGIEELRRCVKDIAQHRMNKKKEA